jgi:hypothetical protein
MRNSQSLSIAVTMVVTFSLSFAIMWNRRPQEPSRSASTPESTITPVPAMTPAPVPVRSWPPGGHREPPTAPVGAQASPAGSPAVQTPAAQALPAMPVALNIGHNHRHNTTEASMVSLSESPVSIQVSIVNPSTHRSSNLRIELAPHSQQYIGTAEGVELNPGDQVTLQNPSYQDLTQQVP